MKDREERKGCPGAYGLPEYDPMDCGANTCESCWQQAVKGTRMKRLTKREQIELKDGQKDVACNYKDDECNDRCMYDYCKWNKEALKKLKAYEDAEEQGLLVRLPCKVGDIVYQITRNFISTYRIRSFINYNNGNIFFDRECINGIYINVKGFHICDVGKTVFLTREEAEKELERMGEGC